MMRTAIRGWPGIAVALALTGCASSSTVAPSITEALQSSSREFADDAPPRVIAAAESVLRNVYRRDISILQTGDGFTAARPNDPQAVVAASGEQWQFHATATPPRGTRASVTISGLGAQMGRLFSEPGEANLRIAQALSRLFWTRVSYVLGRGEQWPSCRQAFEEEAKATGQDYSGMCELLSDATDTGPPARMER